MVIKRMISGLMKIPITVTATRTMSEIFVTELAMCQASSLDLVLKYSTKTGMKREAIIPPITRSKTIFGMEFAKL